MSRQAITEIYNEYKKSFTSNYPYKNNDHRFYTCRKILADKNSNYRAEYTGITLSVFFTFFNDKEREVLEYSAVTSEVYINKDIVEPETNFLVDINTISQRSELRFPDKNEVEHLTVDVYVHKYAIEHSKNHGIDEIVNYLYSFNIFRVKSKVHVTDLVVTAITMYAKHMNYWNGMTLCNQGMDGTSIDQYYTDEHMSVLYERLIKTFMGNHKSFVSFSDKLTYCKEELRDHYFRRVFGGDKIEYNYAMFILIDRLNTDVFLKRYKPQAAKRKMVSKMKKETKHYV